MKTIVIPNREFTLIEEKYISKIENLSKEKRKFDNSTISIKDSIDYVIIDLSKRFERCKTYIGSLQFQKEYDFLNEIKLLNK